MEIRACLTSIKEMLRHSLFFILLFLAICGCSNKDAQQISQMNATIYYGSKSKHEKFKLITTETHKTLNFKYVNLTDSTKTIEVRALKNTDTLYLFGSYKFIKNDTKPFVDEAIHGLKFDFYDPEVAGDDATGPILFNPTYGLLGMNNVYGPTVIMLPEKDNTLSSQIVEVMNRWKMNF